MDIRRAADKYAKERNQRAIDKTMGRFEVATLTPVFTVFMDGSSIAVEAEFVPGQTYIVGTTGTYLHQQGQAPLCIPSKRGAYP